MQPLFRKKKIWLIRKIFFGSQLIRKLTVTGVEDNEEDKHFLKYILIQVHLVNFKKD